MSRMPEHLVLLVVQADEAAHAPVRAALVPRQRALADAGGIVMAGRDIGTDILPHADLKLYLDASAKERARRRTEERGLDASSDEAQSILADLRRRDAADSGRKTSPLAKAADAVEVDTTQLTLEQVIECVVTLVEEKRAAL